jgi:hypothetical protein
MQQWLNKEDGMEKFISTSFLKSKFTSFLDAYEHILTSSSLQVDSTQHDYTKRKNTYITNTTLTRILQDETNPVVVVASQQQHIEIDYTNKLSFSFTSASKPKRNESTHSLIECKTTATPEFKVMYSPKEYPHNNILTSSCYSKRKHNRKSHSSSCYRESVLSCACNNDTLSQISVSSFNTTSFFDSSSEYSEEII